jgi:pimeloyl-ACP methyl ester carboxylesterase
MRRHPGLIFRPDYEVPIAAIVEYCLSRREVDADRLALYGISFGGYFATRAAEHDRRIRALIANSPIIDLEAYMSGFVAAGDSPDEGEDVNLDEVDDIPDRFMPATAKLGFKSSCRRFGVTSFSSWFEALESYKAIDRLGAITCPVLGLVGAGEGEEAINQHRVFCDGVSGPVTSREFTAGEGADMHCQLGNLPLSNAVIYDWLTGLFG